MIKCVKCGKELEPQENQNYVFCPKCGTKNEIGEKQPISEEDTKQVIQENKTEQDSIKKETDESSKNAFKVGLLAFVMKYLRFVIAAAIIITTIPIILIYANTGKGALNTGELKIDFDSNSLIGENFEDVKLRLTSAGFKSIELISAGLNESSDTVEGSVKNVSISGNTTFKKGEIFKNDDIVRITFYSKQYPEGLLEEKDGIIVSHSETSKIVDGIKITFGYFDVTGKNYKDVKTRFEALGFTNFELSKTEKTWLESALSTYDSGDVKTVTINGEEYFKSDSVYPKDAKIHITYYE